MRDEVAVQIGLGEEGDAGVVRQYAVARHGEISRFPDGGQRLHQVEVRAYHAVIPVRFDECAQICGVPGVCVVDRRGDAGRAVNIPGTVERIERRGRFFHNCRIGAGYEALGILSGRARAGQRHGFRCPFASAPRRRQLRRCCGPRPCRSSKSELSRFFLLCLLYVTSVYYNKETSAARQWTRRRKTVAEVPEKTPDEDYYTFGKKDVESDPVPEKEGVRWNRQTGRAIFAS